MFTETFSIYLKGLRRAPANLRIVGTETESRNPDYWERPLDSDPLKVFFFKVLQFTANRVLVLPKHKRRTITIGLRKSILDRVWSDR